MTALVAELQILLLLFFKTWPGLKKTAEITMLWFSLVLYF